MQKGRRTPGQTINWRRLGSSCGCGILPAFIDFDLSNFPGKYHQEIVGNGGKYLFPKI